MPQLKFLPAPTNTASAPPEVDDIVLNLLIWEEGNEVKFVYAPTDKPRFFTPTKNPKLTIKLSTNDKHSDGDERYHFHSYTTTGKKSITKVTHWLHGSPNGAVIPKPHIFPVRTGQLQFELDLLANSKESTYINVIVLDRKTGELIGCDPQVENGTKVGTLYLDKLDWQEG